MPETLEEVARDELHALWDDLLRARDSALRGRWSMECDWLVGRIKRLTPLVGPTPWEEIQSRLLEDGTYQRIHREIGVEVSVDMEQVAKTRTFINRDA